MKLVLNTKSIQDAVSLAIATVGHDTEEIVHLEVMENRLYLYSGRQYQSVTYTELVSAELSGDNTFATHLYRLESLLSPSNSENITIETTKSKATITSGKLSGTLSLIPPQYFVKHEFPTKPIAIIDRQGFIEAIDALVKIGNANSPALRDNIQFDFYDQSILLQATDSYKYGRADFSNQIKYNGVFIVNGPRLSRILHEYPKATSSIIVAELGGLIAIGVPHNFFLMPRTVETFSISLDKAKNMFNTNGYFSLAVDRTELISAINAAKSVTQRALDVFKSIIELDISKFGVSIITCICKNHNTEDVGTDKIVQDIDFELTSENWKDDLLITFHAGSNFLLDIVKSLATKRIEIYVRSDLSVMFLVPFPEEEESYSVSFYALMPRGDARKAGKPPLKP